MLGISRINDSLSILSAPNESWRLNAQLCSTAEARYNCKDGDLSQSHRSRQVLARHLVTLMKIMRSGQWINLRYKRNPTSRNEQLYAATCSSMKWPSNTGRRILQTKLTGELVVSPDGAEWSNIRVLHQRMVSPLSTSQMNLWLPQARRQNFLSATSLIKWLSLNPMCHPLNYHHRHYPGSIMYVSEKEI